MASFIEKTLAVARRRPELQIFICPPMYRTTPLWYRDSLPEVMLTLSSLISKIEERPSNLWVMPAFAKVQLESDGVHLNPYSGSEFIVYLFSASETLIKTSALPLEARTDLISEAVTGVEGRVAALEQDHARLSKSFELQCAISAEFAEFNENVRNEDFIMVSGLPRLPKLDPKEWQVRARADVDQVLEALGFEHRTRYILNSTGRGKDSRTLYKARLTSASASKEVRDKFSSFFAGGKDSRPASLSQVSIRNCVTPGTLARLAILQLLGRRYKESNPGSRCQVVSYESRPLLKLTPPQGASDTRTMTFNYIEAIQKLPTCFTPTETSELMKRISPRLHSCLRSTFGVVSEDMLPRKKPSPTRKRVSPRAQHSTQSEVNSGSESTEFRTPESATSSRKRAASASRSGSGPRSKK